MNAAMNAGQPLGHATTGIGSTTRPRVRGVNDLRWLGLVAGTPPANHDELASQSLSVERSVDDTSHWIA